MPKLICLLSGGIDSPVAAHIMLKKKFDIVFLDPPYGRGLTDDTLHLIAGSDVLKEGSIVIAEHHYKETLSNRYRKLQLSDRRKYGSTEVSFFLY